MKRNEYDAIIIGFGKGGKTLAAKLGASGKKVALAEMDSDMYGGTCINVGCIPSKSLITSAAKADPHAPEAEKAAAFRRAVMWRPAWAPCGTGRTFWMHPAAPEKKENPTH